MSNKLVKISGRKVTLVYKDPNEFQWQEDSMKRGDYVQPVYSGGSPFSGNASFDAYRKTMTKEERFVSDYMDCFPLDKQNKLKGTLSEIQAYGDLRCKNGMTIWQNWQRY